MIIIRVHQGRTAEQEPTTSTEADSMSFGPETFRSTQTRSRGDMRSFASSGQPVTVQMKTIQHTVSESNIGGEVTTSSKHGSGEV